MILVLMTVTIIPLFYLNNTEFSVISKKGFRLTIYAHDDLWNVSISSDYYLSYSHFSINNYRVVATRSLISICSKWSEEVDGLEQLDRPGVSVERVLPLQVISGRWPGLLRTRYRLQKNYTWWIWSIVLKQRIEI